MTGGAVHFVNADLLAIGLSPLKPELGAMKARRLVLQQLDQIGYPAPWASANDALDSGAHCQRRETLMASVTNIATG